MRWRPQAPCKVATWVGLGLSLFSMLIIRQAFRMVTPEPGTALTLAREACMFAAAGVLVWLVRKREGLPLASIGIGTSPLWKSLAWGVMIAISSIVPAAVIVKLTGYGQGLRLQAFAKLPVWVVFVVVLRAGIVEDCFFGDTPSNGCGRSALDASRPVDSARDL